MKANNPIQIFKAAYRYAKIPFTRWSDKGKPTAYFFGFTPWKLFISDWFPQNNVKRHDRFFSKFEFYVSWAPWILADRRSTVYVWGYKHPDFIIPFCKRWKVPYFRMEDGFIRSVALGAEKVPPLSLCFDAPVLYFDATAPSRMETIIQTHDFQNDHELMQRARQGIDRLINSRLSKYNSSADVDIEAIYGPKNKKRVLVVGQVEGDMSIIKGCNRPIDNNDLVRIAARENPDAQIIYKPHPEVLRGIRKDPPQSKPDQVRGIAMIMDQDVTLADAFRTVDHVYTITSLSGFEALIRGIKVTCVGMPFYAGWGATDDRQKCSRRTAKRTAEEIFAAAYLLYPKYYDPILRKNIAFEEALDLLHWMKKTSVPTVTPVVEVITGQTVVAEKQPLVLSNMTEDKIKAMRAVLDYLSPAPKAKPKKPPPKKMPIKLARAKRG